MPNMLEVFKSISTIGTSLLNEAATGICLKSPSENKLFIE